MNVLRRLSLATLALLTLALPARATWSIILIDMRTGEIAVGSATCLTGFNLLAITPVIVVNRGAATAQAAVNFGSIQNRRVIWNLLKRGWSPPDILVALAAQDPGHQSRQYGIVNVAGGKVTFSGTSNSAWAGGVTGNVGSIHYAIQGNILTGRPVVTAAEQAVINTAGDLAEKLMAAMEAARAKGGDGRCSCSGAPTSCGSPPPSFTKSAHIGYMVVARQGDHNGSCNAATVGCASGTYWMNFNVAGQNASALDPVLQMRTLFNAWRTTLAGRPDHHNSTVTLDPPSLIPDGVSTATVTVTLRDWQGNQLPSGGAQLRVNQYPATTTPLTVGAVTDFGNGAYSFPVTAGTRAGFQQLRVTVDDGVGHVLLSPGTTVEVRSDPLWARTAQVSAAGGGLVRFELNVAAAGALRPYVLAASASGTQPGVALSLVPQVMLPLNPDPLLLASLGFANGPLFVNTVGVLDIGGHGQAGFVAPGNGVMASLIGRDLDFAFALFNPLDFASNAVGVTIRQ